MLNHQILRRGPAGTRGDSGPIGPAGIPGPRGLKGFRGIDGIEGIEGNQGPDQGLIGTKGPKGIKGPIGDVGLTGIQGVQGSQGLVGPSPAGSNALRHLNFGFVASVGMNGFIYLGNINNPGVFQIVTSSQVGATETTILAVVNLEMFGDPLEITLAWRDDTTGLIVPDTIITTNNRGASSYLQSIKSAVVVEMNFVILNHVYSLVAAYSQDFPSSADCKVIGFQLIQNMTF